MDMWLVWSLVLFVLGLLIVAIEVFLPSGGLLGIIAATCLIGSLVCAYQIDGTTMAILAAVETVCVPAVIVLAFKILPKTAFGRQLFLGPPADASPGAPSLPAGTSDLDSLLNQVGLVVAALRPSGTVDFNGRRVSVVSDGVSIAKGATVRVIEVEGNRVVVEEAEA